MREFKRSARVKDVIMQEVSSVLLRDITDPRLEMVTITGAKVSDDLRHADVFYSLIGDEERWKEAREGFESSRGFIKKCVARKIKMKYIPDIKFREDRTLEKGDKIDRLLSGLNVDSEE